MPSSNQGLRQTDWKRASAPPIWIGSKTAYLPPEETIDVEFPMNRLFDMTLSGNYTIKVVTSVSVRADREKLAEVSSNSIQVVVKE